MRKILIITGLGMALSLGGANVVSAQGAARPQRAQQDSSFRRGRGGLGGGMLLKGITLSAEQKAKVTAIREHQRAQFDAQRKANGTAARPDRQRGDTTGFGARRAEFAKQREAQVNELRAILTSEQRVQFDKNVAEMKSRVAKGGRDGEGKKRRG